MVNTHWPIPLLANLAHPYSLTSSCHTFDWITVCRNRCDVTADPLILPGQWISPINIRHLYNNHKLTLTCPGFHSHCAVANSGESRILQQLDKTREAKHLWCKNAPDCGAQLYCLVSNHPPGEFRGSQSRKGFPCLFIMPWMDHLASISDLHSLTSLW